MPSHLWSETPAIPDSSVVANDTEDAAGTFEGTPVLVSIVVPCFNEEQMLLRTYSALSDLVGRLNQTEFCDSELILVDDGSTDRTWELIAELASRDSRVRGFRLSRNFGHQAALACGYRHSRGDVTVCLDADLQDPPDIVPEMVRAWREGADIVFAVRRTRSGETLFKLATARVFYWLFNKVGTTHVKRNVGDFRLLSRRSLDALLQLAEHRPFYREMVAWIGFPTAEIEYDRQSRAAGTTKYTLSKMVRLARDALVSTSTMPLQLSWYAALTLLLVAVLLVPGARWLPDVVIVPTPAVMLVCTAIVLLGQGMQSLYLTRLYDECRGRPLYVESDVTVFRIEPTDGQRSSHICLPRGL